MKGAYFPAMWLNCMSAIDKGAEFTISEASVELQVNIGLAAAL